MVRIPTPDLQGAQRIGAGQAAAADTPYSNLRMPDLGQRGRDMSALGSAVGMVGLALEQNKQEALSLDAQREINAFNRHMQNPDSGYASQFGVDALGGADRTFATFEEFHADLVARYRERGMSDDGVYTLETALQRNGATLYSSAAGHELSQGTSAILQGYSASIGNAVSSVGNPLTYDLNTAVRASETEGVFEGTFTAALESVTNNVNAIADRSGLTPEARSGLLREQTTALVTSRVGGLVQQEEPRAAESFLRQANAAGLIDSDRYNSVMNVLDGEIVNVESVRNAVEAIGLDATASLNSAIEGAARDPAQRGMQPRFSSAMTDFMAAAQSEAGMRVTIASGYRTPERQAEIIGEHMAEYGFSPDEVVKWYSDIETMGATRAGMEWESRIEASGMTANIALPNRSFHQHGVAADISVNGKSLANATEEEINWLRSNAGRFGLTIPMDHEDWHVELAGVRDGSVPTNSGLDTILNLPTDTDRDRRIFLASLEQFNGINAQIAVARNRITTDYANDRMSSMIEMRDQIMLGEMQFSDFVPFSDEISMDSPVIDMVRQYFEVIRSGANVSTDTSSGSTYSMMLDAISNPDREAGVVALASLLRDPASRLTVSPTDLSAVQAALQHMTTAGSWNPTDLSSVVESVLSTGRGAEAFNGLSNEDKANAIAQAVQQVLPHIQRAADNASSEGKVLDKVQLARIAQERMVFTTDGDNLVPVMAFFNEHVLSEPTSDAQNDALIAGLRNGDFAVGDWMTKAGLGLSGDQFADLLEDMRLGYVETNGGMEPDPVELLNAGIDRAIDLMGVSRAEQVGVIEFWDPRDASLAERAAEMADMERLQMEGVAPSLPEAATAAAEIAAASRGTTLHPDTLDEARVVAAGITVNDVADMPLPTVQTWLSAYTRAAEGGDFILPEEVVGALQARMLRGANDSDMDVPPPTSQAPTPEAPSAAPTAPQQTTAQPTGPRPATSSGTTARPATDGGVSRAGGETTRPVPPAQDVTAESLAESASAIVDRVAALHGANSAAVRQLTGVMDKLYKGRLVGYSEVTAVIQATQDLPRTQGRADLLQQLYALRDQLTGR